MRRPAIGSTPSTRLPPALGPPTAAPVVLVGALLALAVLLAVLAVPAFAGAGPGGEPAVPGRADTEVAGRPANASPAAGDPTTAELARRLDRETARLHEALAAATAAQRATEDLAGQASLLAVGALIVGLVGLVVAALAWGRQTPATDGLAAIAPGSPTAPAGRPAAAPTGRPSPAPLRARSAQLPRRP
jgi:hypothetical protein